MAVAGALEIQLFAGIARLQKDMNEAKTIVGSSMKNIDASVASAKKTFDKLATAMKAAIGIFGARELIALSDQFTLMSGKIKNATGSQQQFNQVMADTKRIAAVAQIDLGAIAQSYSRLLNNTKDLDVSQDALSRVVETTSLALKVNGAAVFESSSALQQLSQAFGKGKLDGDEFRTMMEAAPGLMRRVAESMGVPFGALKDLAKEGKITGDVLVKAFSDQKYLDDLREQAKGMMTIAGAFQVLKNNIMEFVGQNAQSSGAVGTITGAIGLLAENLKTLSAVILGVAVMKFTEWIAAATIAIYKKVTALVSSAAAIHAERAATIAATAAEVERLQATLAYIAADRAATLGRMQAAQATIAATAADAARAAAVTTNAVKEVAQVQAVGLTWRQFTAERMAEYMRTEGGHAGAMKRMGAEWQIYKATAIAAVGQVTAAVTAASAEQTAVAVTATRAQTAALAANTAARAVNSAEIASLAALGTLQAAATTKMTAAVTAQNIALRTGGVIAAGAAGALALLGGPIGAITLLLGFGATAWALWGNAAKNAGDEAKTAIENALLIARQYEKEAKFGAGNVGSLRAGIEAIEKRIALLGQTQGAGAAALLLEARGQVAKLNTALAIAEGLKPPAKLGTPTKVDDAALKKAAQAAAKEYDWLMKHLQEGEDEWQKTYTEAWQAYEEFVKLTTKNVTADNATMWQQVFAEIDAEQERLIEEGAILLAHTEDVTDEMTEFWKSAAQSMQSSMSDFFFDVMQGNLTDLGKSFKRTIDRMISDMIAAQAAMALFGKNFGKGDGQLGGLLGQAVNFIGGQFGGTQSAAPVVDLSFGGAQAKGGDYMVTKPTLFLAGESGPERATFSGANRSGNGTVNNFSVDMRGASMEAVARLELLVMKVNGSIESRAVAATTDWSRRR